LRRNEGLGGRGSELLRPSFLYLNPKSGPDGLKQYSLEQLHWQSHLLTTCNQRLFVNAHVSKGADQKSDFCQFEERFIFNGIATDQFPKSRLKLMHSRLLFQLAECTKIVGLCSLRTVKPGRVLEEWG
jgi:hypothetical protein